ncbi:hypothetical protein QYM36_016656 [Artemia franciscana]|uniref:PIPK domain-containing protein n=1 Tax=Artemia franciscana TaxID=6661 RepID=A0AA88H8L4_ARTSF|nr:hypothetical protein QYM36_016656 [Artemia franciscana]
MPEEVKSNTGIDIQLEVNINKTPKDGSSAENVERLPRSGEDNAPVEEEQAEEGEAAAHSALKPSATIREKIGHRRVMEGGQVTYKKIQSSQITGSIQLGIHQAVGGLASKPERDLLMHDFYAVETIYFPQEGSGNTLRHDYSPFTFKTYAPIAFRYFRDLFGIQPSDYLASKEERSKKSPTFKDLDFMEIHPEGILLESETYDALMKTMNRDCRVLESFKIMDYSLLVGVHNVSKARNEPVIEEVERDDQIDVEDSSRPPLARSKSINRQRLIANSTALESIQVNQEEEENDFPSGAIPAWNESGDRLALYLGIIDILQSYRFKKKLEHAFKSLITDGDTVSVHRPNYYSKRFLDFMKSRVFKKINTQSFKTTRFLHIDGIPSSSSTPPPGFEEALDSKESPVTTTDAVIYNSYHRRIAMNSVAGSPGSSVNSDGPRVRGLSDIQERWAGKSSSVGSDFPHFISPTPTWTEGTPSYTESSSSEISALSTSVRSGQRFQHVIVSKDSQSIELTKL